MAKRRLPTFLRGNEPERLLAAAACERDALLMLVMLHAGLRVSEATRLKVEQIDVADSQLLVYAGKGNRDRYVALSPRLRDALATWIGDRRRGWLFPGRVAGKPLTRFAVNAIVEGARKRASIERALHPHTLRHTFATTLLERGVDVYAIQQLLGHSSIQVTSVYLHCQPSRLRDAVSVLG